jgi:hypothetical protein
MVLDLFRIVFVDGVFHFSSYKGIRILLEDAPAGACTKVYLLAAVHGAGIIRRVFQPAATSSYMFWFVLVLINIFVH